MRAFISFAFFLLSLGAGVCQGGEYVWHVAMGSCVSFCGEHGIKLSMVYCKNMTSSTAAALFYCNNETKPEMPTVIPCNRRPCPREWVTGSFGSCSAVCDGLQSRDVYCSQLHDDGRRMIRVPDDRCSSEVKPSSQRPCGKPCIPPTFYRSHKERMFSAPIPSEDVVCSSGESIYIRRGHSLRIDAIVKKGYPIPTLTWTLPNGTTVVGATDKLRNSNRIVAMNNGSLAIYGVQLNDEGTYGAMASNVAGTDYAKTSVTVVEQPFFKTPIVSGSETTDVGVDVVVHAGSRLLIRAELIRPVSHSNFVWTTSRGFQLKQNESSKKFSVLENGTLVIDGVQNGETGTYGVVVRTMGGTARAFTKVSVVEYEWIRTESVCSKTCGSSGLKVTVSKCVERRTKQLAVDDRCIVAGLEKPLFPPVPCNRFRCLKTEVVWTSSAWLTGAQHRRPCENFQTRSVKCALTTEDLILGNITKTIADDLSCLGLPKPLRIRISDEFFCLVAPRFRLPLQPPMPLGMSSLYNRYDLGHSLFGVEGRILYVDAVLAKGFPEPKITWTFDFDNGTTLRPGESLDRYHVFENGTLRITNVSYHDQGLVETIANNSVGRDRIVSAITIYVPPKIVELRTFRNRQLLKRSFELYFMARPGDSVAMQCVINRASPPPSYRWFRNGSPVVFEGRFTTDASGCLIISNVAQTDSDVYECVTSNMVGEDRRSVFLEVESLERKWVRKYLPCSRECGRGKRLITSECRISITNFKVDDNECSELRRPMSVRVTCNPEPCLDSATVRKWFCRGNKATAKPSWIAFNWSKCSKVCGKGKQRRKVKCVNPCTLEKAKGCSASERPLRHRRCNNFRCYGDES